MRHCSGLSTRCWWLYTLLFDVFMEDAIISIDRWRLYMTLRPQRTVRPLPAAPLAKARPLLIFLPTYTFPFLCWQFLTPLYPRLHSPIIGYLRTKRLSSLHISLIGQTFSAIHMLIDTSSMLNMPALVSHFTGFTCMLLAPERIAAVWLCPERYFFDSDAG